MIQKDIIHLTKFFFVTVFLILFTSNINAEEEEQDFKDIILKIETISKDLKTLETAFYKTSELKPQKYLQRD